MVRAFNFAKVFTPSLGCCPSAAEHSLNLQMRAFDWPRVAVWRKCSCREETPAILDYKTMEGSLYNTPPCWTIYMCGLVFDHMLQNGGLDKMHKQNQDKAQMLYDAIDGSSGFYKQPVDPSCRCGNKICLANMSGLSSELTFYCPGCMEADNGLCMLRPDLCVLRSLMNVPFTISKGADLEAKFLKEATKAGLVSLFSCYIHNTVSDMAFPVPELVPVPKCLLSKMRLCCFRLCVEIQSERHCRLLRHLWHSFLYWRSNSRGIAQWEACELQFTTACPWRASNYSSTSWRSHSLLPYNTCSRSRASSALYSSFDRSA